MRQLLQNPRRSVQPGFGSTARVLSVSALAPLFVKAHRRQHCALQLLQRDSVSQRCVIAAPALHIAALP